MNTAVAPENASVSAGASSISARTTSHPCEAHASPFFSSRTTPRTGWAGASNVCASAPPALPVMPVIAYIVVLHLISLSSVHRRRSDTIKTAIKRRIHIQPGLLRRGPIGHSIGDLKSPEGGRPMAFDGRVISNIGVLAAIVEGGSFARASEALGLSRSGVSRAVARLEARVGVRLLDRTTRAVALTDEGRRLYSEVGPLLTGIEDAVTVTSGSSVAVRGRLRVSVDAFFSQLLLAPHVCEFLALYPDLALELVAKYQLGDLVGDGFDVAVRFGTPPDS